MKRAFDRYNIFKDIHVRMSTGFPKMGDPNHVLLRRCFCVQAFRQADVEPSEQNKGT